MTTINASEEGYKKVLKKKREMEEKSGRVVSIAKALDALLGDLEETKKEKEVKKE